MKQKVRRIETAIDGSYSNFEKISLAFNSEKKTRSERFYRRTREKK
jgi:hypothetical protein